jgi:hypothetical protein
MKRLTKIITYVTIWYYVYSPNDISPNNVSPNNVSPKNVSRPNLT